MGPNPHDRVGEGRKGYTQYRIFFFYKLSAVPFQFFSSITNPILLLILQAFRRLTYVTVHSPTFPTLYLCHSSFSNPSVASRTSQLILQLFFRFSYVTGSSLMSPGEPPTLKSRCLQGILPKLCLHLQYGAHSPTFPSLHLRNVFILQPFRRFTYVTAYSTTLPLLHLCHSSFSNPCFASRTSQALHLCHLASRPCCNLDAYKAFDPNCVCTFCTELILQPFRHFTYVTVHSPILLSLLLHHKLFT